MSAAVSRTGRTSGRAAPFRCSDAARERCDALTGTATHVRGWLVLEDPGPWGQNAWRDARLPDGLGATMLRRAQAAGIRPLLARRPVGRDGSTVPRRRRVFVAYTRPGSVSMVTTTLSDPAEVLDIDLGALAAGVLPEWTTTTEPFLGVCTHGRHDACCAIRGRPTAHRLAEVEPDCTWEVSHIGGDRFAANLLVLPAGLYFGQLDAESVTGVVVDYRAGVLDLEHFRGRSGWPMVVQVAEAALRRETGYDLRRGITLRHNEVRGDGRLVTFELEGQLWAVEVDRAEEPPAQLTCTAARSESPITWRASRATRLS
jgi:hypothetical protein